MNEKYKMIEDRKAMFGVCEVSPEGAGYACFDLGDGLTGTIVFSRLEDAERYRQLWARRESLPPDDLVVVRYVPELDFSEKA